MSGPLLTSLRLTFFPFSTSVYFRVRPCPGRESRRPIPLLYGPERSGKPKTPGGGSRSGQPRKSSEASMLQLLLFGCIVFPLIAAVAVALDKEGTLQPPHRVCRHRDHSTVRTGPSPVRQLRAAHIAGQFPPAPDDRARSRLARVHPVRGREYTPQAVHGSRARPAGRYDLPRFLHAGKAIRPPHSLRIRWPSSWCS